MDRTLPRFVRINFERSCLLFHKIWCCSRARSGICNDKLEPKKCGTNSNLFPCIFRQNLDPGNHHPDDEIWQILKDFHLDHSITSLDEEINDETSLSSG